MIVRVVGNKILRLVTVLLAVSVLTFVMINILPGDIAYVVGGENATAADITAIRHELGLDKPIIIRYFKWLGNIIRCDLGISLYTNEKVLETIFGRLPVTIELLIMSQFMALLFAVPTGIASAYANGGRLDHFINGIGFAILSIPGFVMALLMIFFFALRLKWLPATGYVPITENFIMNLKSFILPALSIAAIEWVVLMRVLRSDLITTLQQNFILTARAKGFPPWHILLHHALRPSSFTFITVFGIQIGRHIGETVIIETIFALPGLGRLMIDAVYTRDYPMVQGCIVVTTFGYVMINSVVDMMYTLLDPRLRTKNVNES